MLKRMQNGCQKDTFWIIMDVDGRHGRDGTWTGRTGRDGTWTDGTAQDVDGRDGTWTGRTDADHLTNSPWADQGTLAGKGLRQLGSDQSRRHRNSMACA